MQLLILLYILYRGFIKGGLAPQIFGSAKLSEFSANAHSRLVSIVLDGVLGPISAVLVATQKASQGSKMPTRELLGETIEKSVSR